MRARTLATTLLRRSAAVGRRGPSTLFALDANRISSTLRRVASSASACCHLAAALAALALLLGGALCTLRCSDQLAGGLDEQQVGTSEEGCWQGEVESLATHLAALCCLCYFGMESRMTFVS